MRGREARVYLAASDSALPHWSSTLTTDVNFDDDDVTDFAGQVIAGPATCTVSDRDEIGAGDTGPGFSLTLGGISGSVRRPARW